jgi:hypothetical protein
MKFMFPREHFLGKIGEEWLVQISVRPPTIFPFLPFSATLCTRRSCE